MRTFFLESYEICKFSPLAFAAERGDEAMVNLLLNSEAGSNDIKKKHVWRALVVACEKGETGVVKLLLDQHPFEGMNGDSLDPVLLETAQDYGQEKNVSLLRLTM
jgi:ankyrin repeat protein